MFRPRKANNNTIHPNNSVPCIRITDGLCAIRVVHLIQKQIYVVPIVKAPPHRKGFFRHCAS